MKMEYKAVMDRIKADEALLVRTERLLFENAFDHVVKATAFNRDGEDVLGDSDVIGQKLDKVVAVLVESAKDKGYIKKSDAPVVSLTAVTDNSRKGARIAEKAKDAAEAVLNDTEDELAVTVDVVALARQGYHEQDENTPFRRKVR